MRLIHFGQSLLAGVWLTAAVTPAQAHEFNLGALFVDHPHILATEDTTAIGLLEIRNDTQDTEQLTAVIGDGVTLLHLVEVGGEMRSVPVDRLAIPRSSTLSFSPDGLHLVFENDSGFAAGGLVQTTFVFETAGPMDVIFVIEAQAHAGH